MAKTFSIVPKGKPKAAPAPAPEPTPTVADSAPGSKDKATRFSLVVPEDLKQRFHFHCNKIDTTMTARLAELVRVDVEQAEKLGAAYPWEVPSARGDVAAPSELRTGALKQLGPYIERDMQKRFKAQCILRSTSIKERMIYLIERDLEG